MHIFQSRQWRLAALMIIICGADVHGQGYPEQPKQVAQRMAALQRGDTPFLEAEPLRHMERNSAGDALWNDVLTYAELFTFDREEVSRLITERAQYLNLSIPNGATPLVLQLERVHITTADLVVTTSDGTPFPQMDLGLHYRGIIKDDLFSLVAVSISDNELMGMISDRSGQRVLGRLQITDDDTHILYHESDLLEVPPFICSTEDPAEGYSMEQLQPQGGARSMFCVRYFWEAAYEIYQSKGSVANVVTYLTGLFNQSASIFYNDGIDVILSEVHVWNTPSPYDGDTSVERLFQFAEYRTDFNGDLAHLLDYGGMGGVAFLDVMCEFDIYNKAYSGIHESYNNVPAYSWSVMVVTHEQGHNLGSAHTHSCVWNGNFTAIDGCGPTHNIDYWSGDCPIAEVPVIGGTVMSYCHLLPEGVNVSLGFGPQPAALMEFNVNNAWCLEECSPMLCSSCPSHDVQLTASSNWQNHTAWNDMGECITYKLDVVEGSVYEFKTGCGNGATTNYDTYMHLFDANCTLLTMDNNSCGAPMGASSMTWPATYTGALFVRIGGVLFWDSGSHTLAYRSTDTCTPCPAYDIAISPSTTWQTSTSSHEAEACVTYQVPVIAGLEYIFKTGCGNGATADHSTQMELHNANCILITTDEACEEQRSLITFAATTTGMVYLKVFGNEQEFGSFTLAFKYNGNGSDHCDTVPSITLMPGDQVVFAGDNSNSTSAGDFVNGSPFHDAPVNWHAFTTTACTDLRVAYCGFLPEWQNALNFLAITCPADSLVLFSELAMDHCDGGNHTIVYEGLPAGDYFLPVLNDTLNNSSGPYTLEVSASICGPSKLTGASLADWSIYPNPATNTFTLLNGGGMDIVTIQLTDMAGRSVWIHDRIVAPQGSQEFSVSSLSAGVYMVRVFNQDRIRSEQRLLVQ